MKTFLLKIASPEGDLFSGEAVRLCVRGTEGELAVMAGHISFATAVKPCDCKIELEDGTVRRDTPTAVYLPLRVKKPYSFPEALNGANKINGTLRSAVFVSLSCKTDNNMI